MDLGHGNLRRCPRQGFCHDLQASRRVRHRPVDSVLYMRVGASPSVSRLAPLCVAGYRAGFAGQCPTAEPVPPTYHRSRFRLRDDVSVSRPGGVPLRVGFADDQVMAATIAVRAAATRAPRTTRS